MQQNQLYTAVGPLARKQSKLNDELQGRDLASIAVRSLHFPEPCAGLELAPYPTCLYALASKCAVCAANAIGNKSAFPDHHHGMMMPSMASRRLLRHHARWPADILICVS